ncbi:PTS system cellobiose-specific IIC component [Enterococcus sp. PF1-24]|uniref:PTS sugar transporter subunit IIC n=1 Tax=unclassified Enterococcus TaxID=2608891 RepID=UPI0024743592|nr:MULTISPECIES: PTS transporter subunit EIIC [unclassified Enterococcus]MDH6365394.1 PTS system cellobiose-specific IIC component [Enterococcus sp. PFB1-1]MDH6402495.1 PTS system cellobiose-specific IIC component [Enterococcus sp. PF1-24]
MKFISEKNMDRVLVVADKIANFRYLKGISDGLASLLSITIVGSIFLLLGNLPINGYSELLAKLGLDQVLPFAYNCSVGLIAVYGTFFIAQRFAQTFDIEGSIAGLLSLVAFFIVTPSVASEDFNGYAFTWLGAQGLFVAIIISLLMSRIYVFIIQKDFVIKMPDGVPPTVSRSFAAIIPAFVIITLSLVIKGVFAMTSFTSIHHFVYQFIQTPLEHIGGSFAGIMVAILVMQILWVMGIHGSLIVYNIMTPIFLSLDTANLTAFSNGEALPNIVGGAFMNMFAELGGAGCTIGLNLLMLFMARSQRYKTLGRLAIVPSIGRINEPIVFGTPLVMNPIMAIPFIVAPLACATFGYVTISLGIFPRLIGASVPMGIPVVIQGLLQGSWKLAVLHILCIIIATLIYLPFFRILDKQAYEEENNIQPAEEGTY